MTDHTDPATTVETDGGSPQNLFWLKTLVIGLAVAMAIMMLLIVGRIGYMAFGPDPAPPPSQALPLGLPDGATINTLALDRGQLAIHAMTADGKPLVEIRDVGSGALIRRFEGKAATGK